MGRITEHLDPRGKLTTYLNDPAGDRLRTRIVETCKQQIVGGDVEQNEWIREGDYEGTYYRFDRVGNLVERRDQERDLHLVWDANQRMVESWADGAVTRYGYDPLGRRLFKETRDKRTVFYWDGDTLVGEVLAGTNLLKEPRLSAEGNVVELAERRERKDGGAVQKFREYVYYPETFEPLALIDVDWSDRSVYHYHNDPNGCPTRLTDADGEVKWGARYTAWGGIAELYVDEVENPIRLQGQYVDEASNLSFNRSRYYETQIGQFVSQDMLRLAAGLNIYSFAPNIFGWIDPLGLNCRLADAGFAREIAEHSQKHNPRWSIGDLEEVIRDTIMEGEQRSLSRGRRAYNNPLTGRIVIVDPSSAHKGTSFIPGRAGYFDDLE